MAGTITCGNGHGENFTSEFLLDLTEVVVTKLSFAGKK